MFRNLYVPKTNVRSIFQINTRILSILREVKWILLAETEENTFQTVIFGVPAPSYHYKIAELSTSGESGLIPSCFLLRSTS